MLAQIVKGLFHLRSPAKWFEAVGRDKYQLGTSCIWQNFGSIASFAVLFLKFFFRFQSISQPENAVCHGDSQHLGFNFKIRL